MENSLIPIGNRMLDPNPQAAQMAHESMVRNLERQAEAIWPQESRFLDRYHLAPGKCVVDVGCGTGEIAWRLAAQHWGKGYATEGAQAALAFGFGVIGLEEILSFTVPANVASRRVMEKIGMSCDRADDFEHPSLAVGHRLRHHVLYRAQRSSKPITA